MTRMERLYLRERDGRRKWRVRRLLLIGATIVTMTMGGVALADPEPGSTPCVPGQHGNPQPGFKAPPCPGR